MKMTRRLNILIMVVRGKISISQLLTNKFLFQSYHSQSSCIMRSLSITVLTFLLPRIQVMHSLNVAFHTSSMNNRFHSSSRASSFNQVNEGSSSASIDQNESGADVVETDLRFLGVGR